jgi:hypothetical protein
MRVGVTEKKVFNYDHLKPDLSNMSSERGRKLRNTSREGRYSRNRRNLPGHLTLLIDKDLNQ